MTPVAQSLTHAEPDPGSGGLRVQCRRPHAPASDPWEDEAEELAEWLARRDVPDRAPSRPPTPRPVHPARTDWGTPLAPEQAARLNVGPGRPLAEPLREGFEQRLGRDLGEIRIHDQPAAQKLARSLGAEAFTVGCDIYTTSHDPVLLAHEVVHTVQQAHAPAQPRFQAAFDHITSEQDPKVTILLQKHLRDVSPALGAIADEMAASGSWFMTFRASVERANAATPAPTLDFDDIARRAIEAVEQYAGRDTGSGSPIRNGVASVLADYCRINDAPIPAARLVVRYPYSRTLHRSGSTATALLTETGLAEAIALALPTAWVSGRPDRQTQVGWADEIATLTDEFLAIVPRPENLPARQAKIDRLRLPLLAVNDAFTPPVTTLFDDLDAAASLEFNELFQAARTSLTSIRGHAANRLQGVLTYESEHPHSQFENWRLATVNLRHFTDNLGNSTDTQLTHLSAQEADTTLSASAREAMGLLRSVLPHAQETLQNHLEPIVSEHEVFWARIVRMGTDSLEAGTDDDLLSRAGTTSLSEALLQEESRQLLTGVARLVPILATGLDDYFDLRQGQSPPLGSEHDLFLAFAAHHELATQFANILAGRIIPPLLAHIETAIAAADDPARDRYTWFAQKIQMAINTLNSVKDRPIVPTDRNETLLREHFNAHTDLALHFDDLAAAALTRFVDDQGVAQQRALTNEIPAGEAWARMAQYCEKAYRLEYLQTSALFLTSDFVESSYAPPARIAEDSSNTPIVGLEPYTAQQLAEVYQTLYDNQLAEQLREANTAATEAAGRAEGRTGDSLWIIDRAVSAVEALPYWTRPHRFASPRVQWNRYAADGPRAFGALLEASPRFQAWEEAWERTDEPLGMVLFKSEGGPGDEGEAWAWSLPLPQDLVHRLFSVALLRGIVALDDVTFDTSLGALALEGDQAVSQLPRTATHDEQVSARRQATATAYAAFIASLETEGERQSPPSRADAWDRYTLARQRALRLEEATGNFLLTGPTLTREHRDRLAPEIRAEMEAAQNEAHWQMRRATTLDRAVVRQTTLPLLQRAAEEHIAGMPYLGYALRNIDTFTRAIAPTSSRERRLQTSALILELLDPFIEIMGGSGSIGSYETDAYFYLAQARGSLEELLIPEPTHPAGTTPSVESHSCGIQWSTDDGRNAATDAVSDRSDRIQTVLERLEGHLTDYRWRLSISASRGEKKLFSHVMGHSAVEGAELIQQRNASARAADPDAEAEPDYIDLGGGLRVRIARIHQDFTYLPGIGDTARARNPETSRFARYLNGEVYLGVTASSLSDLESHTAATVEDPDGTPPVAAGASTAALVDVEVLHGEQVLSRFTIHANQLGGGRSELNWLATVVHQKAEAQHWAAMGAVLEGYGNLLLTIASFYPPIGIGLAAVEILNFWDDIRNNPEFRAQLEQLIQEPVETLTNFASAMTEHFSMSGLFDIAMNGHFDAPAFAQRSPRQRRGRPMGGRKVAKIFTRLKRIAAVTAVRLERYQEGVQGPIHSAEGELAEHPRLATITHWAGQHAEDLDDPLSLVLRHPIAGPIYEAYALFRRSGSAADASFGTLHEPVNNLARGIEGGLNQMKEFQLPQTIVPLRFMIDAAIELMLAILRRGRGRVRVVGYLADLLKEGSDAIGTTDPLLRALEELIRGSWQDPNTWWADHILPLLQAPIESSIQSGGTQINDLLVQVPILGDYLGHDSMAGNAPALANTVNPPVVDPSGVSATANPELDAAFDSARVAELVPEVEFHEEVGMPSYGQISGLPDAFLEGMVDPANPDPAAGTANPAAGPAVSPRLAPDQDGTLIASQPSEPSMAAPVAEPLAPSIRDNAETRFGQSFDDVRVHRGADASALTAAHHAEALTAENHIYLRPGLSERSGAGSEILDHELAHVLQKRAGRSDALTSGHGLRLRSDEENAADRMADRARHNPAGAPVPVEGAHGGGASPTVSADLIETFLRKISSPGSAASLAAAVQDAHQRASIADLEANVQTAAHQLWNIIANAINSATFTVPAHFQGSKNNIKEHLLNRLTTLPLPAGSLQRSLPAASQVIDHLAVRRQTPVRSRRRSGASSTATPAAAPGTASTPEPQKLEALGFLDDLALYIAARSGIVFDLSGPRSLEATLLSNPRATPRIQADVRHIELYFVNDATLPGGALWNAALHHTWPASVGDELTYRDGVKGTLREHFRTDPPATTTSGSTPPATGGSPASTGSTSDDARLMQGGFTPIWDTTGTSDLKFRTSFKEEVDAHMHPAQLDYTLLPPWPIYVGVSHNGVGSTRFNAAEGAASRTQANTDLSRVTQFATDTTRRNQAAQIGIHYSTHADLTGGDWNLGINDRNSHHIVQYLLPEYFSNSKTFQPFPGLAPNTYPGVDGSGTVTEIRNLESGSPTDTIKVSETDTGRGGVMPAILLSARAHLNSDLHVTPQADDTGSSSQGYAIHRKFEEHLKNEAGGTGSAASVANAYTYLRGNVSSPQASGKLHRAISKTYEWLWKTEMKDNLIQDMPAVEADYYLSQFRDTAASASGPGTGTTRRDALADLHGGTAPNPTDIEDAIRRVARHAETFALPKLAAKGWRLP